MLGEKMKIHNYRPMGLVEGISRNLVSAILSGTLQSGEQLIEARPVGGGGVKRNVLLRLEIDGAIGVLLNQ